MQMGDKGKTSVGVLSKNDFSIDLISSFNSSGYDNTLPNDITSSGVLLLLMERVVKHASPKSPLVIHLGRDVMTAKSKV